MFSSFNPRTILLSVCISAVIIIFIAFAYTRLWGFLSGPGLILHNPPATAVTEPVIAIEGYAPRATEIAINGAPSFLTESGAFGNIVTLSDGYNVVTVTATDRFGATETSRRVVIYNER